MGGKAWKVIGQMICVSPSKRPIRFVTSSPRLSIGARGILPRVTALCGWLLCTATAKQVLSKVETHPPKKVVSAVFMTFFQCENCRPALVKLPLLQRPRWSLQQQPLFTTCSNLIGVFQSSLEQTLLALVPPTSLLITGVDLS